MALSDDLRSLLNECGTLLDDMQIHLKRNIGLLPIALSEFIGAFFR